MSSPQRSDPWSVSETALYRELRSRLAKDEPAVLATIVDVEGSAYRRPGAKMLISPGTDSLGAVTAGCLEDTVVDMALDVLETGNPRIKTFDLMDTEDWGLGLGCNGVIDILLEPVDQSLEPALAAIDARDSVTIVTVVDSTDSEISIGDRMVLGCDGKPLSGPNHPRFTTELSPNISQSTAELHGTGQTGSIEVSTSSGTISVCIDSVEPTPRLLLFGTQNDVQPVSRVGQEAGFDVLVASARGSQSTTEDFPFAHDIVITHPTGIAEYADDRTYAILMSHNFIDDRLALETLLTESSVPYVGLMGPRERFQEMREELSEEGTTLTESQLERISTPVGLDLGGDQPGQIAVSLVSEVLAVHNGRPGGRLRERSGPIHERSAVAEQSSGV